MGAGPDAAAVEEAKRLLRAELRAELTRASPAESSALGRIAAALLGRDRRWRGAKRVGLFAPVAGEPDTRPIFDQAIDRGQTVLLPRCPTVTSMEFAPVASWDVLRVGRYGLFEPSSEIEAEPWSAGDVLLVPGTAFDRVGGRLGRGGGHYDRHLEGRPRGAPWLVGFGFSFQLVSDVPMARHDRRLDGLLAGTALDWWDEGGA